MNRREFIRLVGAVTAGAIGEFFIPSSLLGKEKRGRFNPDVEIQLSAVEDSVEIFNGKKTNVWRYRGKLIKGPSGSVENLDSYLGPVIRVKRGDKVRVIFRNDIPDKTIVHWHGLHVPERADGHPRSVIGRGDTYIYEFEVKNRAGTYWFHPHPHGRTGPQVYFGLAGLFLITDDEEQRLDLPEGEDDIPLVIQDRTFDREGQLVYLTHPMQRMMGFLGNEILVNGRPDYTLELGTSAYRLRILNGSNSRIYKLAWSDGRPITVIATDGGLLQVPTTRDYVMLGPAERVDVWLDLSDKKIGDTVILRSLEFEGAGMFGMMRRMGLPNGSDFDILRIRVTHKRKNPYRLPSRLSQVKFFDPEEAVNIKNPRTFVFEMMRMQPTINGRTFSMTGVARDEIVHLNTVEVWKFVNSRYGMQMPHPVHVHDVQFQIINRTPSSYGWETIKDGFVDGGWKDTILLMPGMEAEVVMKFEDYTGLYLYHCHNLEHEDLGMMRNFLIKA